MSQRASEAEARGSLWQGYATAAAIVGGAVAWLWWVVLSPAVPIAVEALVRPMLAQFWLTALVWLVMLVTRNAAVLRGAASLRYFVAYQAELPDERLERPARTFDNLMQVPTLFYVICLLMLVTQRADEAQEALAWTFVAWRALHAALFITLNRVPCRFASWVAGCITLGVLWYRFAAAHGVAI